MSASPLEIRPIQPGDIAEVARQHFAAFGDPTRNGHSVATLGPTFLADVFYRLNLDNPGFHCDVACAGDRIVAFTVFSTDKDNVFSHLIRRHPVGLVVSSLKQLVRRPSSIRAFLANAMYLRGERLEFLDGVPGWWVVCAILPDFRSASGEERVGRRIVVDFLDRMEEQMTDLKCPAWYGVVDPSNTPINRVLQRRGATEAGRARAQGLDMVYYVKRFDTEAAP